MSALVKTPLIELCEALDETLRQDPRGAAVPALLEAYAKTQTDWEPFKNFVEGSYTRSLVRRTEDYDQITSSAPDYRPTSPVPAFTPL